MAFSYVPFFSLPRTGSAGYSCGMQRIIISGTAGGGGKTLLALGLCRAFTHMGLCVRPFKKGPDYIDAAWLARAAQQPCTNLDPYFLSEERLRSLFAQSMAQADVAVIEGNRGLYDGRDVEGTCSTAALSRTLDSPVLLTLTVSKMTRTAAAVAVGLAQFEPIRLAGVVLNQVGTARHESLVRKAMEAAGIPVLGALPRLAENPIPERHMGLVSLHEMPHEAAAESSLSDNAAEACLERLGSFVAEHVDLDTVLRIAGETPFPSAAPFWSDAQPAACGRPRIGYVYDAALWFYYNENLEALERAGAELVRVSLFDAQPWPHLDGLYLGGGFPELFAADLSCSPRLADLRTLASQQMPIYAECGGLMVLCRSVQVKGVIYPLSGVLPADTVFESRPQGLGYVEATVERANPFHPVGTVFRGHEFHYSRCVTTADTLLRLADGTGMGNGRDGLLCGNVFASYTHLFAPAVPHWAANFVRAAKMACNNTPTLQTIK